MSTDISASYLFIRIRLHLNRSGIVNLQLLVVPIYERHTAEVISEVTAKLLNALYSDWRAVIVGISTNDQRKLKSRNNGVATLFQKIAEPGFICV